MLLFQSSIQRAESSASPAKNRRPKRGIVTLLVALALSAVVLPSTQAWAQECRIRSGGKATGGPTVVYFDVSSAKLKSEGQAALDAISARYKGVPGVEICLIGQADATGNVNLNEALVKRRIATVENYLKTQGLDGLPYQTKVRSQAFGETFIGRIVGKTAFESDRRVEIKVIEY